MPFPPRMRILRISNVSKEPCLVDHVVDCSDRQTSATRIAVSDADSLESKGLEDSHPAEPAAKLQEDPSQDITTNGTLLICISDMLVNC